MDPLQNFPLARQKSSASLRRKRDNTLDSASQRSATPSDQRAREEKSASYKHPHYEVQLQERGSFMHRYEGDISNESKELCQTLLTTPQNPPEDSLFSTELFEKTFIATRNRNEPRIVRDITPLLIPPAENLAIRGAQHMDKLIETVNEAWSNAIAVIGPRPQPDYSLGFRRTAFSSDRLKKLQPLIGQLDEESYISATYNMLFPFLTGEVKCGASALDTADRQNAHSMTVALIGVVNLFRAGGRQMELHRKIMGFSVSHDDETVRIYGHYPVIQGSTTKYYRHPIRKFDFTELDGKERWTAYTFIRNVYELWAEEHFQNICSAIDSLPDEYVRPRPSTPDATLPSFCPPLENSYVQDPNSSFLGLQPTPDASTQSDKSASEKRQRKRGKG